MDKTKWPWCSRLLGAGDAKPLFRRCSGDLAPGPGDNRDAKHVTMKTRLRMSRGPRCRHIAGVLTVLLGALVFTPAAEALAQQGEGIAAIVNDEVISTYDVNQRVNLVLASSGIQRTPEIDARIREQVLQTLIDEKLELQEAARYEVEISEQDIDAAINQLVQQNNMTLQEMEKTLRQNGISMQTLRDQIKAELAWTQLVNGLLAPRVSVTAEEVDQFLTRLISSANTPQYLVSEIFLEVPSPDQEQRIAQGAMQLIAQMQQGVPFNLVAQQFSQNASAAQGGDLGWVQDGELAPELNEALRRMQPGQVSPPIRTLGGYTILALRDRRILSGPDPMMATLKLQQVALPLPKNATPKQLEDARKKIEKVRDALTSCDVIKRAARKVKDATVIDLGELAVGQLADRFRPAVATLAKGETSEPVRSEVGLHVFIVCDRKDAPNNSKLPTREQIENRLYNQQLSMLARRYLRDLRRDSAIEMR